MLAKGSQKSDARAMAREFATQWLPRRVVEAEILAPALEDAGVDENKMAAVGIREDLLNLLLVDLMENGASPSAEAKLDALSRGSRTRSSRPRLRSAKSSHRPPRLRWARK